ncbi:hypothetical protein K5549_014290 [Capra hircus]|nr:hypothetical protein K5549_014290 [Capra hircus]
MVSGAGSEGGERRAGAGEPGGSGARVRDTGPSRRVRPEGAGAAPRGQGPGTGARAGPLVTVTFSPSEAPVRGARRRSYRRRRGSLSVDEKPVRREQPPPLSSPGRICPPPPIAPSHGPPQPAGSRFRTLTSARNAEKAMTALARFRQAQLEEGKVKERRPFLASECTELPKAEKWRRQIIGEISKKVAQIQNAGLGEFRIRDLNDEINKLLREKGHWEVRIKELGGPDYGKVGPKMLDHEGKEVPGNRGYKYFGAAKDLPGVRELFEKEPLPPPRKTRAELMKAIDFEYYGYLDEDDGVIVPLEQEYEKKHRAELAEKWKAEREARLARGEEAEGEEEEEANIYAVAEEESDEEGGPDRGGEDGQQKFIAHVPVPSQQEIEEALVRRKKMELLQKYTSETLQAQSEEARRLLGC